MELADKDLKIDIINIFKDLITNVSIMRKEMEDIKENKMKIFDIKNIYLI